MTYNPNRIKPYLSILLFILVLQYATPVHCQDKANELLQTIKAVPLVYYTPEAYSYFARSGQPIPPQPPRETAAKAYRAAISLGNMPEEAQNLLPDLIELFPRVIHVTEIRNTQYSGGGSFEDWLMTYLTSEKNKFLLSSPVLDFNSMSQCEPFIESAHQVDFLDKKTSSSGNVINATVNLSVIFTLYIGACVLTTVTGADIGNDQQNWRNWYEKNSSTVRTTSPSSYQAPATDSPKPLADGQSFKDILVKGTYRMVLTTGVELTGVVEYKSDTALIFETTEGKPYTFRHTLIRSFELLQRPQIHLPSTNPNGTPGSSVQLTFDELRNTGVDALQIEISVAGGTIFKGTLASIDESMLKINVSGSIIPITREAIRGITLLPSQTYSSPKVTAPPPQTINKGPQDTLIIKNTATDDWGRPKPDFVYTGIVQNQNDNSITLKTTDGVTKSFNRSEIVRITLNTKDNSNEPIKRYAKPLFCPDDMFLVDMPPGKQGKPFFKVCVDRYEFPNKKESAPAVSVSFLEAKNRCESQGKRLCTAEEWQWACSGLEGYAYPYGWNRDDNKCNTEGNKIIEASGSRLNCVSKFGGYDMTGNVFEWVVGSGNEPLMMGGPYAKCQTTSPGLDGSAKPQVGLRCCKSN